MPSFKNIAKIGREHRIKAGLTQCDIAEKLGYKNAQFVSNIERGLCSIPVKNIKAYCKLLNMDVNACVQAMIEDYRASIISDINSSNS